MYKRIISLTVILCLFLLLSGCGHELASYRPIEDVNDLEGRKIGVTLAWASDYVLSLRETGTTSSCIAMILRRIC